MISESNLLRPDWPVSARVQALCTTRKGGVSQSPWQSLNLGVHVGDNPVDVARNRQCLATFMGVNSDQLGWLNQVHGTWVVELTRDNLNNCPDADASFTREQGVVCAILTADCLPVILADCDGRVVGAAHAGWRSLCGGVLENLIRAMAVEPSKLTAWFGPSIGPANFEVGPEVRAAFVEQQSESAYAFSEQGARPGHFIADIYELARLRLSRAGVSDISGEDCAQWMILSDFIPIAETARQAVWQLWSGLPDGRQFSDIISFAFLEVSFLAPTLVNKTSRMPFVPRPYLCVEISARRS